MEDITIPASEVAEAVSQRSGTVVVTGVVGLLVGLSAGTYAGWKYAERRLTTRFEEHLVREIADTKAYLARVHKTDFQSPGDAVAALVSSEAVVAAAEAQNEYVGAPIPETREFAVVVRKSIEQNVFDEARSDDDPDFDYEHELLWREQNPGIPYVVSQEEFMQNEGDNQQSTLTFFTGDEVLLDERDAPIPDVKATLGPHLDKFGYGASQSNLLYIRNPKMGMDFEVVKSDGKYAHEVLGLQHSNEPRRRKVSRFRGDDE